MMKFQHGLILAGVVVVIANIIWVTTAFRVHDPVETSYELEER